MSADASGASVPASGLAQVAASAERFTQARIERIIAVVVALGCAVLGTQSVLNAVGSTQETSPWHGALAVAAFGSLGVMVVALFGNLLPRTASGVCAVVLVVVFACWPAATAGVHVEPSAQPWIWYLINVATAAAVPAFPVVLQLVWAFGVPVLYGAVRAVQLQPHLAVVSASERAEALGGVALDAAFALILACVIVALGWMLRAVGRHVDAARVDAVASYAEAAAADAAETERVAVAALMHDSVLAALIAAERAGTPREEALAVAMAREALTRLANAEQDAGEGPDEPVAVTAIVAEIERAARELGSPLAVAARLAPGVPDVPGRVARALVLAATQGIANAVQHAEARGLEVEVRADAVSLAVRVRDAGGGFAPRDVAADRLGIRGSIVARMAAAGGTARVHTGPSGTTVRLDWERAR